MSLVDDPIWTKIISWYYDNGYPMAGYFNQQIRREWAGHDVRQLLTQLQGPATTRLDTPKRRQRRGAVRTAEYDFKMANGSTSTTYPTRGGPIRGSNHDVDMR